MKLYKNITISFLSALLTIMVIYGGYTIYAGGYGFQVDGLSFSETFISYNGEMNDYFNDRFDKLNELMEDGNFYNDEKKKALFLPPKDIDQSKDDTATILEKCGEENVSSYCVSIGALDRYVNYVRKLSSLKNSPDLSVLQYLPIINALSSIADQNIEIDQEIYQAENVMKATVSAYNEYTLAYPMHKKYLQIIENLSKYKQALKSIRLRAMEFPVEFIDSTSSQCE